MKFDLDIFKVFQKENLLLIKFKRTEGGQDDFRNIITRILLTLAVKKN